MRLKLTGFALAGVAALMLGVCSVAVAAVGLAGTYTTTISSPAQLKGKWSLILVKGGAYSVKLDGARRSWQVHVDCEDDHPRSRAGQRLHGRGTYAWKKSGKTMTFVRKRETSSCQARALILGHRFTQVR